MNINKVLNKKQIIFSLAASSLVTAFIIVFFFYSFGASTVAFNFGVSSSVSGKVKNLSPTVGSCVNCPGDCYCSYSYSTGGIKYQAYPAKDFSFKYWTLKNNGSTYLSNPISITRTSSKNYIAEFIPNTIAATDLELPYAQELVNKYAAFCPILNGITVEKSSTLSIRPCLM